MSRVGIAGLWHETNTYSSRVAGRQQFQEFELLSGKARIAAVSIAVFRVGLVLAMIISRWWLRGLEWT